MGTGGGNGETPEQPDIGFWQGLFDSVKGWFDNLRESIGGWFDSLVGKVTDLGTNIGSWFTKVWTSITTGFDSMIQWFKDFPTMLGDFFDYWFNPNSPQLRSEFDIALLLEQRLTFVQQFKNAINNYSQVGQPLQLPKVKLGNWEININGKWFEPHVPKIRASIATLFWVCCALACWRNISSAFGVHANNVAGSIAQDAMFENANRERSGSLGGVFGGKKK